MKAELLIMNNVEIYFYHVTNVEPFSYDEYLDLLISSLL